MNKEEKIKYLILASTLGVLTTLKGNNKIIKTYFPKSNFINSYYTLIEEKNITEELEQITFMPIPNGKVYINGKFTDYVYTADEGYILDGLTAYKIDESIEETLKQVYPSIDLENHTIDLTKLSTLKDIAFCSNGKVIIKGIEFQVINSKEEKTNVNTLTLTR